jgi:hypothetical protein
LAGSASDAGGRGAPRPRCAGVTAALKSNKAIAWQSGRGTNVTPIIEGVVYDPPTEFGFFYFGSGGGPSEVFSKPAFQHRPEMISIVKRGLLTVPQIH